MVGHSMLGRGAARAVVLSDWLMDTSSWDDARTYFDPLRVTLALADLRGYGRSRQERGEHTVEEGALDVLALADLLGWQRFSVVGHSMSCLVALHLAQHWPTRIDRVAVVTPPPPTSFGYDEATVAALRAVALGDDTRRTVALRRILGERLGDGWIRRMAARWRACSDADAVAGYLEMFGRRGLPDVLTRIAAPALAITGEEDAEIMRSAAVTRGLSPLCESLKVVAFSECGHFPMLEAPPRLAATIEGFLTRMD